VKLYVVSDGDRQTWLAARSGEDMYTYVPNTGSFHRNEGVGADFFLEGRSTYRPVGVPEARDLIAQRLGDLDAEDLADLLAEFRAEPSSLPVDAVLSAAVLDDEPDEPS
jgi:hypothetical protein